MKTALLRLRPEMVTVLAIGALLAASSASAGSRTEKDLLGSKEVPEEAYYGSKPRARSRTSRSRA
jgi:hypothetical protein